MVRGIDVHAAAMTALFEMAGQPTPSSPLPVSPQPAIPPLRRPVGRRVCVPLHASPAPADLDVSEFVHGAELLGFEPSGHQLRQARILDSRRDDGRPRYRRTAITMPRRSGKSDGLWATAVGRSVGRSDHHTAFSAQSGLKGRKRFLVMASRLDRYDPCPRPSKTYPDGCTRGDGHVHRRTYRSNGGERIEWANGSSVDMLPPDPESYRGDEYDLIVLDEGQEITDETQADELLGGINPTMDTLPNAQLVVAGTAGKVRAGLLWTALTKGRSGAWGILEYAAPDHADPTDERTWLAAHPGIGTLTTLEIIRENYADLSLVDFQREYLGQWPADLSVSAIDPEHWQRASAPMGVRPERVGLAFDVAPDGSVASLSCAWRDEDGVAYIELLAHRAGTSWLPAEAARVAREARVAVAFDSVGKNIAPADTMSRKRPPVRLTPMNLKDVQGATQRLVSGLADETLKHFDQKDMNLAAEGATWRPIGESGRAFSHKASAGAITPLTSGALALWAFDRQPARRRLTVRSAA